jgi:hypothetical protein
VSDDGTAFPLRHRRVSQQTNKPTNQQTNKPTNQKTNKPTKLTNQHTNKTTNQQNNKPTKQQNNLLLNACRMTAQPFRFGAGAYRSILTRSIGNCSAMAVKL